MSGPDQTIVGHLLHNTDGSPVRNSNGSLKLVIEEPQGDSVADRATEYLGRLDHLTSVLDKTHATIANETANFKALAAESPPLPLGKIECPFTHHTGYLVVMPVWNNPAGTWSVSVLTSCLPLPGLVLILYVQVSLS